ncbi:MAG TPA: DUF4232 domain-containing protein [Acidimicrobiales bacterium]|nr:DUF4232 domain-containing protein [Acidimicrobiales bacterium]
MRSRAGAALVALCAIVPLCLVVAGAASASAGAGASHVLTTGAAVSRVAAAAVSCKEADLAVSAGESEAGVTHVGLPIELRNRGTVACHLQGYPKVVALSRAGRVVAVARPTLRGYLGGLPSGIDRPPLVVVAPRKTASAFVEGFDFDVSNPRDNSCPPYNALLVTLPGAHKAVRVTLRGVGLCSSLTVHPILAGPSGR